MSVDQAMSSEEEETQAVKDERVRKRKIILLPRVLDILANEELPFLISDETLSSEYLKISHIRFLISRFS